MAELMGGLLVVFGMTLSHADLSGRWTLNLDPDFSGNPETLDCTLKQTDATLTADCGGGTPISGEVKEKNVTLRFKTGEDGRATATLTGLLDEGETTVTGKWHLDPDNRDGKFRLKKR